jgi:hypothetical protein
MHAGIDQALHQVGLRLLFCLRHVTTPEAIEQGTFRQRFLFAVNPMSARAGFAAK